MEEKETQPDWLICVDWAADWSFCRSNNWFSEEISLFIPALIRNKDREDLFLFTFRGTLHVSDSSVISNVKVLLCTYQLYFYLSTPLSAFSHIQRGWKCSRVGHNYVIALFSKQDTAWHPDRRRRRVQSGLSTQHAQHRRDRNSVSACFHYLSEWPNVRYDLPLPAPVEALCNFKYRK